MKKHRKLLAVVVSVVMILTLIPVALFANAEDEYVPFIDDDDVVNTAAGNYTISNLTELKKLISQVNLGNSYEGSNFRLEFEIPTSGKYAGEKVIDLTGETWIPIGTSANPFGGNFDGNGYAIAGLNFGTVDEPSTSSMVGFFGSVSGEKAAVKNLAVIYSEFYLAGVLTQVGPIAAHIEEGATVSLCAVKDTKIDVNYEGTVFSGNAVGGLVGSSTNGTVTESYSTAFVSVTAPVTLGNYVGGLVGRNGGTVSYSYFAGNVALGESLIGEVGGLVGRNTGTVSNSYSVALIGGKYIAGVAGCNADGGTISNCYYFEGSAPCGTYTSTQTGVYTAATDSNFDIETFNKLTPAETFATNLNGSLLNSAFKVIDGSINLFGEYSFPILKNNLFEMTVPADNNKFADGNGTIYDPYQITNVEELNNVRDYLSDAFIVKNDITFTAADYGSSDANSAAALQTLNNKYLINDTIKQNLANAIAGWEDGTDSEDTKPSPITSIATFYEQTKDLDATDDAATITAINTVLETAVAGATVTSVNEEYAETVLNAEAGLFADGFKAIASVAEPFVGHFDGNEHTISGLEIKSSAVYASLFVRNLGTIKDLTIDSSSVSLTTDGTSGAYAAAVATLNSGTISNVTADMDVTATSDDFKAYVGGLVAVNTGLIENSENSGIILAKFSDAAYMAYATDYAKLVKNVDIKVGGAVALNETGGVVDTCKSNASARSEFTSASNTDAILESNFIADNQSSEMTASSAASIEDSYITYNVPSAYTRPVQAYAEGTYEIDNLTDGATLSTSETLTGVATYGAEVENYQLVTILFNDTYKTNFLAWLEIDTDDLTVNTDEAKEEFLKGDDFSSKGIVVTAYDGTEDEFELEEVSNDADNGYIVKVYKTRTEITEGYSYTDEVTDLSQANEGTYYVVITYGNVVIGSYEIKVCGIESIEASSDYSAYMSGQKPTLDVDAVYNDTNETKKRISDYSWYIADSEEAFEALDSSATAATEFPVVDAKTTKYIGVIYKDGDKVVKSNAIAVTLLPSDVAVTGLAATTSADQTTETENKIKADAIKLTWTDGDAPEYRVYRSADNGETYVRRSSPKVDYYTDSNAAVSSGTTYKYKVVMVVAGEESAGAAEITVTAPMPTSLTADVERATKYIALYNDFSGGSINVTGTYENGTSERIYGVDTVEEAGTSKYYFNKGSFTNQTPGEYAISLMFNGQKIDGSDYTVEVVAPESISATADYEYYPIGYPADSLKNTISVTATYPAEKINKTLAVDPANFTLEYTPGTGNTKYSEEVTATYTYDSLKSTVNLTFVPGVPPENVEAEAGLMGINTVTWSPVEGAVKYNVYRTLAAEDAYVIVGTTVAEDDATSYSYDDDDASPGEEYKYKVAAVIADQECERSEATDAVETVAPTFIKAFFAEGFKTTYATGQYINTSGISVYAYYPVEGYIPTNLDFDGLKESDNTNYMVRELDKSKTGDYSYWYTSDFDGKTAGTYTVSITYSGAKEYNTYTIGETSVTVYPIYKITATTEDTSYELGSEFTTSDLIVVATYGDANTTVKTSTLNAEAYYLEEEPNMYNVGTQDVTVILAADESITATATIKVFDPDSQIILKDDTDYESDDTYVTGIQPKTTVSELKDNLENDETTIQVVDKNDNELTRTNLATGDKVQLVVAGNPVDELVIVVLGDTTGEGTIDVRDVKKTVNASLGKVGALSGPYLKAANVNGDSKINVQDVKKILNVSLGKISNF